MKLVIVDWVDSHGQTHERWRDLDDIKECCDYLHIRSVGWLVEKNKKVTLIVPHISGEKNGNIKLAGRGDLIIPNKAILKVKVIKE